MKRVLSLLLCFIMAFSAFTVTSSAAAEKENKNLPMIFVTGIGQTFSFLEREDGTREFNYKYADENGEFKEEVIKYEESKNLINFDFALVLKHLIKNPVNLLKSLAVVGELLLSLVLGNYMISFDHISALVRELLYLNIPESDGALPDEVVSPYYTYPVKDYNEKAKERFDKTVPHPDLISAYGEDRVFCFNYAPFGSIENLADKLNDYINNIQERYFPGQKVILVPMSMGAATVSRYLYKYGDQGDVAKVISVVGCWDGSDVFADLIEGKYADDSADTFYSKLLPHYVGDPATSSFLNILLHLFSKDTLSPLVRNALCSVRDEVLLKSSTMIALVPSSRYKAIRDTYLTRPGYEQVLKEADAYYEAQSSLKTTLKNLNETVGTEFYFISGYNLGFGGVSSDYFFFKFFESAATTNSDEIIQIGSTTIGATAVTADTKFSDEYLENAKENGTDKYISPDKSVDLSTAVFPDNTFVFYNQKHELEYNNVAINLILEIANGTIKDINSAPSVYPQFNHRRDLDDYNDYYSYLERIIDNTALSNEDSRLFSEVLGDSYAEIKAEAENLLPLGDAMKATTIIDPESDDAVIAKFRELCEKAEKIIYEANKSDEDRKNERSQKVKDFFADPMTSINDFIYSITGPKGIRDLIF